MSPRGKLLRSKLSAPDTLLRSKVTPLEVDCPSCEGTVCFAVRCPGDNLLRSRVSAGKLTTKQRSDEIMHLHNFGYIYFSTRSVLSASRLKCICALCLLLIWHLMTASLTTPLPLLLQGRRQVSIARDPSEGGRGFGGRGTNNFKGGL